MNVVARRTGTVTSGILILGLAACSGGAKASTAPSSATAPATSTSTSSAPPLSSMSPSSTSPSSTATSPTATSPTATSAASTSEASTSAASTSEATAALVRTSGTSTPAVVQVGTTFEAATLGNGNRVLFWTGNGKNWKAAGSSPHLPVFAPVAGPPTIRGALLPGASHAMFIVDGAFTGDGTGQALAYGRGTSSWSMYAAQPDGSLAPSGHGMTALTGAPGLELHMKFTANRFQTVSLWGPDINASFVDQKSNPTLRYWKARGSKLVLSSSNIFTAHAVPAVTGVRTTPTHNGRSLPDGTWMATLNGATLDDAVTVQPVRRGECAASTLSCYTPVGAPVKFTVPTYLSTVLVGNATSFTAPGWVFARTASLTADPGPSWLSAFRPGAPYVVAPSVATSTRSIHLMRVTVVNGRVTQLAAVAAS